MTNRAPIGDLRHVSGGFAVGGNAGQPAPPAAPRMWIREIGPAAGCNFPSPQPTPNNGQFFEFPNGWHTFEFPPNVYVPGAAAPISTGPVRVFHRMPDPVSSDRRAPRSAILDEYMAILPSAVERSFFPLFFDDEQKKPYTMQGSVAVISIDGPLMQKGGWWYDGYEAIKARFAKALEDKAVSAVVLKINSPGGVCSGCFSGARAMRALKEQAGKPVIAYADESAFSAAYAMASIADEIYLPPEGGVGSVGVIGVLEDWTAFNERVGIKVAVVSSGEYKAYGHPDVALKPAVVARYQKRIDSLAQSFAEIVGSARGMSAQKVLSLEAACLYGDDAVTKGLANGIASFDDTIARAQALVVRGGARPIGIAAIALERAFDGAHPATLQHPESEGKTMTTSTTPSGDKSNDGTLLAIGEISYGEFALAVGLSHDASKGDILAEIARARADHAKVLEHFEAKTTAEVIGKSTATADGVDGLLKAIGAKTVGEATELLAKERKENETKSAKALIEEAVAAGKCAANGEKAFALYEKHGMAALVAHLDALTPQPALVNTNTVLTQKEQKAPKAEESTVKTGDTKLSAEDAEYCERYGLDPVAFAKSKAELASRKAEATK